MLRVIALTHRDPRFLKETYRHPWIDHVDHERFIPAGRRYVSWDEGYRVWKMTPQRVPIPVGKFTNIHDAICATTK